jgi:hypothetical protein
MQSSVAIVLRIGLLFGCLAYLPLMAAGGLSTPEKIYTQAQAWLESHTGSEPLLAQRTIQLELPAEALRYREVGSPIEPVWDESSEDLEVAEVMPANYEEILAPPNHEEIGTSSQQPWTPPAADPSLSGVSDLAINRLADYQQVFEPGERKDLQASPTLADAEDQLRKLGAVDLRLEPWGSTGQFYRYCASMPVAGSAEVQRHFQSIGPSPDQAALDVLAQATAARAE